MTERYGAGRGDDYYGSSRGRSTSWVSVVIGWLSALGASLILSGIIGGLIGAFVAAGAANGQGGNATLVGLLITLFVAFLIGGYTAGRLAGRDGTKHGLLVALLALVVTLVLALIGGAHRGQLYRQPTRGHPSRRPREHRPAGAEHFPYAPQRPRPLAAVHRGRARRFQGSRDRSSPTVSVPFIEQTTPFGPFTLRRIRSQSARLSLAGRMYGVKDWRSKGAGRAKFAPDTDHCMDCVGRCTTGAQGGSRR